LSFCGPAFGVGHEPQSLSDVPRADARSAQIRRPDGVSRVFQISRNTVEPREPIDARNLLTKDRDRSALADEPKPRWPKMARIGGAIAFPRLREGLTGATPGPNRSAVWPAGELEWIAPAADAGEKVALRETANIVG